MNIIKPFINDDKSINFKKYNGYHTGVDIDISNVTALASGVVTFIGNDLDGVSVSVEYDSDYTVRYSSLKSSELKINQTVSKGQAIGISNKSLHLEILKPVQPVAGPVWPVRINTLTHYKHDPTPLADGSFILDNTDVWYNNINFIIDRPDDSPDLGVGTPPDKGEPMDGSNILNK